MSNRIIVTGRREQQSDGSIVLTFSVGTVSSPGVRFYAPQNVPTDGSSPEPTIEVSVTTEKTDSNTDQSDLTEAAKRVIAAVLKILVALNAASPFSTVNVLGRTMTVSNFRDELVNTEFVITDATNFNNRGVGSADYGEGTAPNVDQINYQSIIGDGQSSNYYGNSNYVDDAGMKILILHEIAHMNQIGFEFWELSRTVYQADSTVNQLDFYDTQYASNNEAFAEMLAQQMASAININLHGATTGASGTPQEPADIYAANNGQPYSN